MTTRRSTVHDFSALRLHPDGSRVAIHSPARTDLRGSRRRNTGRDTRGNRIARDAAGLGAVRKRPVPPEDDNGDDGDDGEDIEIRETKSRMPLRRKRPRIDDNFEFLGDSRNIARCTGDTLVNWPVPSSDLLKCVHYFASQYYAAHGLLSDRSRMYKRELRQRRAKVGVVQAADSGAEEDVDTDVDGEDEVDEDENPSEKEARCEKTNFKGKERNEGEGSLTKNNPEMYRAFDGSALMAIGMLLQEHVSMLLKPNIPPGWEEEMKAAGLVPKDESEDGEETETDEEDISVESSSVSSNKN